MAIVIEIDPDGTRREIVGGVVELMNHGNRHADGALNIHQTLVGYQTPGNFQIVTLRGVFSDGGPFEAVSSPAPPEVHLGTIVAQMVEKLIQEKQNAVTAV